MSYVSVNYPPPNAHVNKPKPVQSCDNSIKNPSIHRINYIDALRGLTMFLVVLQHVELFGLGILSSESVIGNIFISFRMPIFFFVSGYIAYKAAAEWNTKTFRSLLCKKARIQLIPTIFFFLLYNISISRNPITSFLDNGWGGYWFTIVLLEMFVVFYSLSYFGRKYLIPGLAFLSFMGMIASVLLRPDATWWTLMCMGNLCKYFQFFSLGIIAKKYHGTFLSLVKNEIVKASALLVFIISAFILIKTDLANEPYIVQWLIRNNIMRYAGLFVVFAFFASKEEFFKRDTRVGKCMTFIGRRTLDIYMLHYFLIAPFPLFCLLAQQNTIMELSVSAVLTIIILSVTLLMSEVIRSSNLLAHYLFGVKRNE